MHLKRRWTVPDRTPTDTPTSARSAEVDAFLAALPDEMRQVLEKLGRKIAAAAPDAVETMGYGVPAFKYRGRPLVSFSAGKGWRSLLVLRPESGAR
jgi:uncharacterized protein YdhG (YjbR/CyaY superfamily)